MRYEKFRKKTIFTSVLGAPCGPTAMHAKQNTRLQYKGSKYHWVCAAKNFFISASSSRFTVSGTSSVKRMFYQDVIQFIFSRETLC